MKKNTLYIYILYIYIFIYYYLYIILYIIYILLYLYISNQYISDYKWMNQLGEIVRLYD